MSEQITLTDNRMIAGTAYAAGSTVAVPEQVAEELIAQGLAVRVGRTPTVRTAAGFLNLGPLNEVRGLSGPDGQVLPFGRYPRAAGGIFCDWQSATGTLSMVSVDPGDDIALDATVTLDGFAVPKCTFSNAASGTYIAKFVFTNPVSLASYATMQVPIKNTCNETASGVGLSTATFGVWLYPSGGGTIRLQCDFANVPPGAWHVFTFGRESPAGLVQFAGTTAATWDILDTQTISEVRFVQGTIAASVNYPVWVGPLRVDARALAHVSICMDGEYSSQYEILRPLLDRYGFKASLAITNSDIGGAGRMNAAQIDEMYAEGHECIHHVYDATKSNGYANATDWPSAAVISADIRAQWAYFRAKGWTRGIGKIVNSYTNPFDKTVAQARQKLVYEAMRAAGVECSRASTGLYTAQMSLGYGGVRPFHLRGAVQISNTHTAADIIATITQAETNGEWAIVTAHRAVAASPGSLEMTTANFATWLDYLGERVQRGAIACAPLGEVYDRHWKVAA
jgi:hypothetical protein